MADRKNPRLSRDQIKTRLEDALSDVERSGSFLTSGSFELGINPGLELLGAGPIGLPLSGEMARRIIQASHTSPYGKGSETLVDESVRNSWELNADQFFLRNPSWTGQIQKLLQTVVSGLGLKADPTQVRAEIYKLVLYEEGAFFLPHQDSEKADGMFGTLVVSLPSKHEGGDVVASHKGESRTFSSAPGSDFNFSYAAWYSDITHEVKPVTSGYRIVLTYNLIHRPSAMRLNQGSPSTRLISLLESWAVLCKEVFPTSDQPVEWLEDEYTCPTAFVYMLDHEYTNAELSFTRLKGADQERVAEVRKACEKTGFSLFLASVVKSQTGSVDAYGYEDDSDYDGPPRKIYDIEESSLVLSRVVEPEDLTFAEDVDIQVDDDDIFVQEDPFHDDPDHEEISGYTGNEGATATHLYRRTGLLIIPPFFRVAFAVYAFGRGNIDSSAFLEKAHSAVSNQPGDDSALQNLRHLYKGIAFSGYQNSGPIQTEIHNSIVQIALEFGDLEVLKQCLKLLGDRLSLSAGSHFGKAILSLGFPNLKLTLDDFFGSNAGAVKKLRLISNIISTYLSECERLSVDADIEITQWQIDILDKILSSWSDLDEADGPSVLEIIKNHPSEGVLKRLMLFLEGNVDNSGFIVGFLICLHDASQDVRLGQVDVSSIYKSILPKAMKAFQIDILTQRRPDTLSQPRSGYSLGNTFTQPQPGYGLGNNLTQPRSGYGLSNTLTQPRSGYGLPNSTLEKPVRGSITWETMVKLLEQCDTVGIDTSEVLEVLTRRALELREEVVESMNFYFFLPFISSLCSYIKSRASRPATSTEQSFIVQLLEIYIGRYVKMPPKEPTDWERTLRINCDCEDCRLLRKYVEDKHKKVGDFCLIGKRRSHLENQLDGTFNKTTIKTGPPYTLRLEKTNERYKIDLKVWNNRATLAKSQLVALSKDSPLLDIIGEDSYTQLLQHECLKSSVADSNPTPPSIHLAPQQGLSAPSIPKKRSFVDLTDT